ncbi:MAG: hypothetical protein ACR2PF_21650 [Rhizobiaceae bacterium]
MAKAISGSVGKGGKDFAAHGSRPTNERSAIELTRHGMTFSGARQVLNGEPVTNPNDRELLAKIAEAIGQHRLVLNSGHRELFKDEVGAFREPTKHPGK